jgi:hypothetical protein
VNEKLGVGLFIAFIATVSIGGMAIDTGLLTNHKPKWVTEYRPGREHAKADNGDNNHQGTSPTLARTDQPSASKSDKDNDCLSDETPKECALRKIQDRAVTFNGWLVGVGFLQFAGLIGGILVYRKQAKTMEQQLAAIHRQADIAENTLVYAERAYLFVREIKGTSHMNPRTHKVWWAYEVVWENTGKTPTRNLRIYTGQYLEEADLPPGFDFDCLRRIEGPTSMAGPGRVIQGLTLGIDGDDIKSSQDGKNYLYIWGIATYNDIFPKTPEHITRFCWRLTFIGDPTRPHDSEFNRTEFHWTHHYEHNCADEDCDKQIT